MREKEQKVIRQGEKLKEGTLGKELLKGKARMTKQERLL